MTQTTVRNTNRLLWTAQILLALLFLLAGTMKFVLPVEKMQGPVALPLAFIRFIGTAEVLGALGLVLPGLLRIRTHLTPLAASGLLIIMIGATVITIIGMGMAPALFPLIVGVIAAGIAVGRWRVVPLRDRSASHVLRAA
jgi:uncharacterized membrane protein YphA (DoxX/SURF4 family)